MRLYGPSIGYASFAVVTRGFQTGLERLGALDGMMPMDALDEYAAYPGPDAFGALACGPPDCLWWLKRKGLHQKRAFMLAPNSSWVPPAILHNAAENCTELLTPSKWGQEVLAANLKEQGIDLPVTVVPHGVLPGFRVRESAPDGPFTVLHLASTGLMRKSTLPLVKAFLKWPRAKEARLQLVVSEMSLAIIRFQISQLAGGQIPDNIQIISRLNASPSNLTNVYHQAHLLCQPSRSEGWGICPCEARVCGLPVALTACTGHSDHVEPYDIVIEHGPCEWIDDGPRGCGAEAPTVHEDAISAGLSKAYDGYGTIEKASRAMAVDLYKLYDWKNAIQSWVSTFEANR